MPTPERRGPVEELARRFENEPRASASAEPEARIREAFRTQGVASDVLAGVLCRESVCKLDLRWSRKGAMAYMGALMKLDGSFNLKGMAVAPGDRTADADRYPVEVYVEPQAAPAAPSGERAQPQPTQPAPR